MGFNNAYALKKNKLSFIHKFKFSQSLDKRHYDITCWWPKVASAIESKNDKKKKKKYYDLYFVTERRGNFFAIYLEYIWLRFLEFFANLSSSIFFFFGYRYILSRFITFWKKSELLASNQNTSWRHIWRSLWRHVPILFATMTTLNVCLAFLPRLKVVRNWREI